MEISAPDRSADYEIEQAYHFHQPAGVHPWPLVLPANYERVELVTGGRGWIREGGEWREVRPGDLIWNREGDETIGRSDWENPYSCLAVTLVGRKAEPAVPRFSRWPDLPAVRAFTDEVARLFGEEGFDRQVFAGYLLGTLLFRATVHQGAEREEEMAPAVRGALEYLEKNFTRPCRMAQLARVAGCSVPHLHDLFRAALGVSPHQWLIRRRLRSARERLVSTRQPVKQIALECGFSDTAAFTNAFRVHSGLPPSKYRERYVRLATG